MVEGFQDIVKELNEELEKKDERIRELQTFIIAQDNMNSLS